MSYRIICADVVEGLHQLPEQSVHCCVTSPPYWGLRDYGTAQWSGGDPRCDHKRDQNWPDPKNPNCGSANGHGAKSQRLGSDCGKCGARRIDSQIGLEKTPDEYVARMVEVFREVRRVLRDDGTLWLNLGDSYCSTAPGTWGDPLRQEGILSGVRDETAAARRKYRAETPPGLKPKDLIGIPWRVAFALQADGWYLRSDIIWHKPNPMPESVTDRPTKAHEYIFLLSKQERYYYDADAIREPATDTGRINGRDGRIEDAAARPPGSSPRTLKRLDYSSLGRNKRTVWTVSTCPTPEAHFATYPPDLIEPCILAGCPERGTVLDPFAGAGTTGLAAIKHGRKFIGIELNPDYVKLAYERARRIYPLLLAEATV